MPDFIPGLKLSELFYQEAVKPILENYFPKLLYAAGLIGFGSDTLGFDTPISRDHSWGPRMLLFLPEDSYDLLVEPVDKVLRENLPPLFHEYPTNFRKGEGEGVVVMEEEAAPTPDSSNITTADIGRFTEREGINHFIWITSVKRFFESYVGIDPYIDLAPLDWLILPQQILRSLTSGKVFHDGAGDLTRVRSKLSYYPADIWRLLLAAQWTRLGQEEAFMGRAGEAGDELGSLIITARLSREVMSLCFLMERQYAPYSKWFGSGFSRLKCAAYLEPLLLKAIQGHSWQEREQYLSKVYEYVAGMHNSLGITRSLEVKVSGYYNRPYLVIQSEIFATEIARGIQDETVKGLTVGSRGGIIGSLDQWVDSTDVLSKAKNFNRLRCFYNK